MHMLKTAGNLPSLANAHSSHVHILFFGIERAGPHVFKGPASILYYAFTSPSRSYYEWQPLPRPGEDQPMVRERVAHVD